MASQQRPPIHDLDPWSRTPTSVFVEACFRDLTPEQLSRFLDIYRGQYGPAAHRQAEKTHPAWKAGQVRLDPTIQQRMLCCVPPVLDAPQRFRLLSLYVDLLPPVESDYLLSAERISGWFVQAAQTIASRSITLEWFARPLFTDEEVGELQATLRYSLLVALDQSYRAIAADLAAVSQALRGFRASVTTLYSATCAPIAFTCPAPIEPLPPAPPFDLPTEPPLVTRYKDPFTRVLVKEAVERLRSTRKSDIDRTQTASDLHELRSLLAAVDREAQGAIHSTEARVSVQGAGGVITLKIVIKNTRLLRRRAAQATRKAWMGLSVATLLGVLLASGDNGEFLPWILLPLVLVGSWFHTAITLRKEVEEHERQTRSQ